MRRVCGFTSTCSSLPISSLALQRRRHGGPAWTLACSATLRWVPRRMVRRHGHNFYRQVTRGLGVMEYLYKPLMRDMVARYFGPLIHTRRRPQAVNSVAAS